ncbi:MAG: hypothetical protein AVDCRST_MAG67-3410, partial [uncultured Solirubrobacteraceae bacterium]
GADVSPERRPRGAEDRGRGGGSRDRRSALDDGRPAVRPAVRRGRPASARAVQVGNAESRRGGLNFRCARVGTPPPGTCGRSTARTRSRVSRRTAASSNAASISRSRTSRNVSMRTSGSAPRETGSGTVL